MAGRGIAVIGTGIIVGSDLKVSFGNCGRKEARRRLLPYGRSSDHQLPVLWQGETVVGDEGESVGIRTHALGDVLDAAIAHSGQNDAGMAGRGISISNALGIRSSDLEVSIRRCVGRAPPGDGPKVGIIQSGIGPCGPAAVLASRVAF